MSIQNIKEVQRKNLVFDVASLLRDSIAKGDLPPGTHLVEQDVSQQLGVSRGPLREALRVLETEGLVRSYPGRGSFVSELSESDIWEIYSLRTILEEEAIRLATRQGNSDDLSVLQDVLDAMFQAAKEGDRALVLDLDLGFHQQIWKMAGHSRLESFLKEVSVQAKMYIAVQTSLYDDLAVGVSDHETILEHLKSGNEEAAADTMRSHLQVAETSLRAYFKEKQSRGDLLNRDVE
jgi:DNA-binding GntR family transcriptional regulator